MDATMPQFLLGKLNATPTLTLILVCSASYFLLVQALRFRNTRKIARLAAPYAANLDAMDYKTAHKILFLTMQYEFPFMFAFGTRWALVKSYSIEGGSHLLVDTRQLSSPKNVGKRTEDTATMLYEMLLAGIDSDRGSKAVAKMNWLHRRYAKRIENDGYIFTLALFVLEPMRWIENFEWRKPSLAERVAYFAYWKEIGYRMGIESLPSTLAELEAWQTSFLAKRMGFDASNKKLADAFLEVSLRETPLWMRHFARQVILTFLEPAVRDALGLESPPVFLQTAVNLFLYTRGLFVRFFLLPRFQPFGKLHAPGPDGRIQRKLFVVEPWYVAETAWTRVKKLVFGQSSRLPGAAFQSEGYLPEELGPAQYKDSSRDEVLTEAAELRKLADGGGAVSMGCPFLFHR